MLITTVRVRTVASRKSAGLMFCRLFIKLFILLLFWGAPKSLQILTAAMKLKHACSLEEKL